jgi:hypothetical protein
MKIVNIFVAVIMLALSVLPLLAPQQADHIYTYLNDIASGKIACHCDAMKDMEESLRQNYIDNNKFAYMIDCNSEDKQIRNLTNQFRILVSDIFSLNSSLISIHIYPLYSYSIYTRDFALETPPPRYSA